jgi:hypothetical protein
VPSWLVVACGLIVGGNNDCVNVGMTLVGEIFLEVGLFLVLGVNY